MNDKGQVRMMETIAVLFIFFILIGLSLIFYAQFQKGEIQEQQRELAAQKTTNIIVKAANLPELKCTKGGDVDVPNCVDYYKLNRTKEIMNNSIDYYFDIFGYATIRVKEIQPKKRNWTIYKRTINNTQRITLAQIPIAIRKPKEKTQPEYYFGVLEIESYS